MWRHSVVISLFAKRYFVELILAQSAISKSVQRVDVVSKLLDRLDLLIKEVRLNEIRHLEDKRKSFADDKRQNETTYPARYL